MSFMSSYYAFERFVKEADQNVTDWLYGSYDKQKLDRFTALYSIPGVRHYIDYKLDQRADEEYLKRYQMTYSDIHDPRKLKQTSSGSAMLSYASRMVSRNVDDLYGNFRSRTDKKKK